MRDPHTEQDAAPEGEPERDSPLPHAERPSEEAMLIEPTRPTLKAPDGLPLPVLPDLAKVIVKSNKPAPAAEKSVQQEKESAQDKSWLSRAKNWLKEAFTEERGSILYSLLSSCLSVPTSFYVSKLASAHFSDVSTSLLATLSTIPAFYVPFLTMCYLFKDKKTMSGESGKLDKFSIKEIAKKYLLFFAVADLVWHTTWVATQLSLKNFASMPMEKAATITHLACIGAFTFGIPILRHAIRPRKKPDKK